MALSFELIEQITQLHTLPLIRARIASALSGSSGSSNGYTIECRNLEEFENALSALKQQIEVVVYDESVLDSLTIDEIAEELSQANRELGEHFSGQKAVEKALSALRSRERELYAITAYAFTKSGRVLFVREETELAPFVAWPHRLFSSDALIQVRRLHGVDHELET